MPWTPLSRVGVAESVKRCCDAYPEMVAARLAGLAQAHHRSQCPPTSSQIQLRATTEYSAALARGAMEFQRLFPDDLVAKRNSLELQDCPSQWRKRLEMLGDKDLFSRFSRPALPPISMFSIDANSRLIQIRFCRRWRHWQPIMQPPWAGLPTATLQWPALTAEELQLTATSTTAKGWWLSELNKMPVGLDFSSRRPLVRCTIRSSSAYHFSWEWRFGYGTSLGKPPLDTPTLGVSLAAGLMSHLLPLQVWPRAAQ